MWLEEEGEKLDAYADDLERAFEADVKAMDIEIKAAKKALRGSNLAMNDKLAEKRRIADFIFAQMMQNYVETPLEEDDYEVRVTRGFTLLQPQPFNIVPGQRVRDFRQQVSVRSCCASSDRTISKLRRDKWIHLASALGVLLGDLLCCFYIEG